MYSVFICCSPPEEVILVAGIKNALTNSFI